MLVWYEVAAEVTVNSRNSSSLISVRCKDGLIYSGNFVKPIHCFHQPKKNVRDFFFPLISSSNRFQTGFFFCVTRCPKYGFCRLFELIIYYIVVKVSS